MDVEGYLRHAGTVLRERGLFIQGVAPSGPTDPRYCYTVGLQRLPRPQPELIVFGLGLRHAGALLGMAFDWVRVSGPLRPGTVVTGLLGHDTGRRMRIGDVLPRWVEAYAGAASSILGRPAGDVPMRQVVLSDEAGRWPEDPEVSPALRQQQPLLARRVPWQAPIMRTPEEDLFLREQPEAALVAVPVFRAHRPIGRHELLRGEPAAGGAVRVCDVPWAADHVAVGDVLQTGPADEVPGLPEAATVMRTVRARGPCVARAFRLPAPDRPPRQVARLFATLWDLLESGRTWLASTRSTLHVNTDQPARFDAAVRPFLRDGLLVPVALGSEHDPAPSHGGECAACSTARRWAR